MENFKVKHSNNNIQDEKILNVTISDKYICKKTCIFWRDVLL